MRADEPAGWWAWCLWRAYLLDCESRLITVVRLTDVHSLPPAVCGLLARSLSYIGTDASLRPVRAALATRLRQCLQPAWAGTAELGEVCAVIDGLQALRPELIDGADIALVARRLIDAEVATGGPYYNTAGQRQTGVADSLTNALVAQVLDWLAAPLPRLEAALAAAAPQAAAAERSDRALWLAMEPADVLQGEVTARLADKPVSDVSLPLVARHIQQHVGLLTAVLALQCGLTAKLAAGQASGDQLQEQLTEAVLRRCLQPAVRQPGDHAELTRLMLDKVMRADADHEISGLAWFFGMAVEPASRHRYIQPDGQFYQRLGAANVYAWAAYTIYDDFLDEEGDPKLLATANYSFRAMQRYYQQAMPHAKQFHHFTEQVLQTVDRANTKEAAHFRLAASRQLLTVSSLPDFGQGELLADRALFHALGPMAVLASHGVSIGSPVWNQTLEAFRHYLIARQLNDDIHDWHADLQAGQASFVVVEVLRYLNIGAGSYNVRELLEYARQQFWLAVLPQVCDTALQHMAQARRNLQSGLPMCRQNGVIRLFDKVEASMRSAQATRRRGLELLEHFA